MCMAEFKFKFIYKCIIICIDCFVVNKNFVLLTKFCFTIFVVSNLLQLYKLINHELSIE